MHNSGTLLGPFAIRYEIKPSMLLESVLIQNFGLLIRYTTLQCYALLPALLSPKLTQALHPPRPNIPPLQLLHMPLKKGNINVMDVESEEVSKVGKLKKKKKEKEKEASV